ncbi:hypothetical protein CJ030_MR2G007335 [Morella rubra]|uniref:Uncharacterized protein n=1 Tax=Morella rubra TaxID=262757 RepID=A0A6A1WBA9_9ROSI|nr:hypothetical protein CJ030_MR2G007335 [Morella rubra]
MVCKSELDAAAMTTKASLTQGVYRLSFLISNTFDRLAFIEKITALALMLEQPQVSESGPALDVAHLSGCLHSRCYGRILDRESMGEYLF